MAIPVSDKLKRLGRVVIRDAEPVSYGHEFRALKASDRARAERKAQWERAQKAAAERRVRNEADKARARELGGIERTPEQDREFREIMGRHIDWSIAYFERRGWEERGAQAAIG